MSVRIISDTEVVRRRTGTLPPARRYNAMAWTATATFVMGWGAGLLCGLGLH
ncbi:hypothetical protein [Sandarakinorhabdus sp. DWP1-3-1]|uniref:hypothetical protein n=1 Tax=Sandarakinorhabdus sp. DWP1-3-1 TaxID=2804627 RepID=UPI003CEA3DA0